MDVSSLEETVNPGLRPCYMLAMAHQDTPSNRDGCGSRYPRVCVSVLLDTPSFISINLYLTKMPLRIKQEPGRRLQVLKLQTVGGLPKSRGRGDWER